jgi:serine O-acetyltransferase
MALQKNIMKLLYLIKTDLYRYAGKISLRIFLRTYIREPGFNYLVWLRIRTVYKSKIIGYLLLRKSIRFGIDIQTHNIGEGFYIGHFGTIIVHGLAVIGKHCNISHGVTIGMTNSGRNSGVPVIGDRVYIAPGAKIIGGINIGNDVAIGANAVVLKDVPNNAVVVGVPAKVLSYNGSQQYINNILINES